MATTNDITGDKIATKPATPAYLDHYDAIFRKQKPMDDWPESRIDAIGQNGGDGEHYTDKNY